MKKINLRGQAGKNVPPVKRFWMQVRKTRGCWEWVGNLDTGGYGRIVVNGIKLKAHRYSWELHNSPIPAGMMICHHCDNPRCIRPSHLFVGDNSANRQDSVKKNRHNSAYSTGEKSHMSVLTQAQVNYIRTHHVRRSCGPNGSKALAEKFGVKQEAIRCVLRGNTWKHGSTILRKKPLCK